MLDDERPFHCSRCGNASTARMTLDDPIGSGHRLLIYDCPNCGKVDMRLIVPPWDVDDPEIGGGEEDSV